MLSTQTAAVEQRPHTPRQFVERRLADPRRLRTGMLWLAIVALAYGGCLLLLASGGGEPGPAPWLDIPQSSYYYWEAAFIAPVIVAAAILAAGCMHLLARAAGGRGSFDDTMALVGSATAVCTLCTLVPDLIIGVLLRTGAIQADAWLEAVAHPTVTLGIVWAYMSVYAVAFLVLFPMVASAAHRLSVRAAVAIGWTGFAIYQGVMYIFVR